MLHVKCIISCTLHTFTVRGHQGPGLQGAKTVGAFLREEGGREGEEGRRVEGLGRRGGGGRRTGGHNRCQLQIEVLF